MIDGYATLVVNVKGDRSRVVDRVCQDERLKNVCWEDMELAEQMLPDGLSNCLVMVFFSYKSVPCGSWEYGLHSEYEEVIDIEKFVVMRDNYKAFEHRQISRIITWEGTAEYPREFDEKEKGWFDVMIEDWQLLHDEEFTIYKEDKNETIIQGVQKPDSQRATDL
jgi:hypothetical protein